MPATIKDISNKTGLAIATISKYLNGGNVLEKNRQIIEQAIEELDFRVNQVARGLKTNRTMSVGVIIPKFTEIFFTSLVDPIEQELRKFGYAVILCDSRNDLRQEREVVDFLINKKVDGIMAVPHPDCSSMENYEATRLYGIPTVILDNGDFCGKYHTVITDNAIAAAKATRYLLKMGHRQIGVLYGPLNNYTSRQRLLGYQQAMTEYGLQQNPELIRECDYTTAGGREGMYHLLDRNPGMTAVFASSYDLTLGAYIAMQNMRLRIPHDISFMGFDDILLSEIITPRLCLVDQPFKKIGYEAAKAILRLMGDDSPEAGDVQTIIVESFIRFGDSVARTCIGTE